MAMGPGKYDDECTEIRVKLGATGVLLIVFGGTKGEGFAMQATPDLVFMTPTILRSIADQVEADMKNSGRVH